MKIWFLLAASVACVIMGFQSPAVAAAPQPVAAKKQLSGCMTKQMSASRSLSYYDAMKLCKAFIKSQEENLIASNEAKPAHAR